MTAVHFDEKNWFDEPLSQWRYTVYREFRCLVRDDGLELRVETKRGIEARGNSSPWASLGYPPNGGPRKIQQRKK
jgi:hypothetical protein